MRYLILLFICSYLGLSPCVNISMFHTVIETNTRNNEINSILLIVRLNRVSVTIEQAYAVRSIYCT